MKKLYWRPQRVSRIALLLTACVALACLTTVEHFQSRKEQLYYREKVAAARLAREALETLRLERQKRNIAIDPEVDPMRSGMIGFLMTPVTSNTGALFAKQTTVNPNFAAVAVHLLEKAGVQEGDLVGVGFSGSFPALNVAVAAAMQTLKLKPVIISSAAASQWGANHPQFLWIDMEKALYDSRRFSFRSSAASFGGIEDRGLGMSKEGRALLTEGIERNGLALIKEKTYALSVEQHMAYYQEQAGGMPYRAYINVGGGTTSVGAKIGKAMFKPGLNTREPAGAEFIDSVMKRFVQDGVPVIHLIQIEKLAKRYGLPVQPTTMPKVGEGKVFFREEYNLTLAAGALVLIVALLFVLIRSEWGMRMVQDPRNKKPGSGLEASF